MTSKFEDFKDDQLAETQNQEIEDLATDCFELLSAYIDGELNSDQQNEVQTRIDQDPEIKHLYIQLLALQGRMQHSVAPPSERSVVEITREVFQSIDRVRRWQRRLFFGGSAIAASYLAMILGIIPGIGTSTLRIAEVSPPAIVTSDSVMLAVAVNKPAINIPKTATGYSSIKTLNAIDE